MSFLLLYCRPGFEKDCLAELIDKALDAGISGYGKITESEGIVRFFSHVPDELRVLFNTLEFDQLIFVRQWFICLAELDDLPDHDRIGPILEEFSNIPVIGHIHLEYLDTNEGKQLSKFCRKFANPLRRVLRENNYLAEKNSTDAYEWQGHLLFVRGTHVLIGYSKVDNASPFPMGIPRLKFPVDAPSRSTLKLEEAWLLLMNDAERETALRIGQRAVDLGAAPGGWTWQLVAQGMHVWSVDNGPMNDDLMATGQVTHCREDAFVYLPDKPVDWMVCDVVDQPSRVAERMEKWFIEGWCRYAIFNLKLPMKKRWDTLKAIFDHLNGVLASNNIECTVRCKHLYHDREEVTVFVKVLE